MILSPVGTAEQLSVVPTGLCAYIALHPPMNRWATFECPYGTIDASPQYLRPGYVYTNTQPENGVDACCARTSRIRPVDPWLCSKASTNFRRVCCPIVV